MHTRQITPKGIARIGDPASAHHEAPSVLRRRVLSAVSLVLALAGAVAVAQVLGPSTRRALPARHVDVSMMHSGLGRDPSVPDAATVLRDQPDGKGEQPDTF